MGNSSCNDEDDIYTCHRMNSFSISSRGYVVDDLEQECEDAVFEVCDARERFPIRCINELTDCIKLENEICVSMQVTKLLQISSS